MMRATTTMIMMMMIRVAIQLAKKTVRRPFRCLLRRIFRRISGVKSSWAMV